MQVLELVGFEPTSIFVRIENLFYCNDIFKSTEIIFSSHTKVCCFHLNWNQQKNRYAFVDNSKLIVAGHSEGSKIAAKLAVKCKKVTHLIYSSGCPLGRIMAMISQVRATESDTDSKRYWESEFDYWEQVVNDKSNMDDINGVTFKATYDFSIPPIQYLEKFW